MLASKPILPSSNLHLPTVSKPNRHRFRSSPIPSSSSLSMASTNASENVSALKAKYTEYAMWLKASSRQNREPIFTHELLKHSLCEMGIDTAQAEQLVSTCSWYVYQFQKELGVDNEQTDQSITTETKKSSQSTKKRHKKNRTIKLKKTIPPREHSAESATTINSITKESSVSPSTSSSPTRNKFSVLPAIEPSDSSLSPRSRRVDFDNEQQLIGKRKSSHWRSATFKARILPKLRPSQHDSSVNNNHHHDISPESTPLDIDLSSSHKSLPRPGLPVRHTRSILRKQTSTCSSVASTDMSSRRHRNQTITPASTIIDEMPLGTRSQRLFGGSECFAEIMNELEEQKY